ncbi:MAG TPA: hypothetical protein VM033_02540 [Gemmatimonadaceae bacterium]|nr:hypothetical protein [Gemmatimonadaceae bacterium]
MTSAPGTGSCATLLRDASRRLTHEVNNAANGVALNLEVVRIRTLASGADAIAPFAERASHELEQLTAMHEVLRSLLQLAIEHLDEEGLSCAMTPAGDAVEITFAGAVIPRGLRAGSGEHDGISMRNGPHGVILSVPRTPPGSE